MELRRGNSNGGELNEKPDRESTAAGRSISRFPVGMMSVGVPQSYPNAGHGRTHGYWLECRVAGGGLGGSGAGHTVKSQIEPGLVIVTRLVRR